jgi:hypothetical protein
VLKTAAIAACVAVAVFASGAAGATGKQVFHPRIGNALGLVPPVGSAGKLSAGPGALTPVTYHGGDVMNHGVTVHLIFWAPSGYAFQGSPGAGIPSYEGMIEQFFTDVAADSGPISASNCTTPTGECNIFSTLTQYGSQSSSGTVSPGDYSINFSSSNTNDVIQDTDPYPTPECTSPQNTKACILDSQLQEEVDSIASTHGNGRGLSNLWYVFTPPDVDECIFPGACETNAFGGYHSLSNVNGHGVTIYAFTGDPVVETSAVFNPGNDPEGNPDAEIVVDIAGHETNEAMTDPEGVGWMDPNGFEVADKCEFGPQIGTPLGFAANGSPYNQVINGDQYLTQEMWSNDGGQGNSNQNCVQGTTSTSTGLPLPQVNLTQFSDTVTGNIAHATAGVGVKVTLLRGSAGTQVAQASGTTDSTGAWSVTLARPVGDDRDEIDVDYSGTGAPTPHHQVILTGNGDDPFVEAGWTGWTALDEGFALTNDDPATGGPSLTIAPCFQTGVESYTIAGIPGVESPTDFCGTASDAADAPLAAPVTDAQAVTYSTNDNRAFQPPDAAVPNGTGGLVKMTVPVGEPDSVGAFGFGFIAPTGFPTCTADLGAQQVSCTGLVPSAHYTLKDGSATATATADGTGTVATSMAISRGDTIALSNSASRTLTTLHVANLKVTILGDGDSVESGTCSPLQYWGGPLTTPPTNFSAGEPTSVAGGSALTGDLCPAGGSAAGLPTSDIAQTDQLSGGQTVTKLADVVDTSPIEGETVYGTFTALAEASDGSSKISLSITHASGGSPVFTAANVDTSGGVTVKGLKPGNYTATWTVTNPNGDTRIVTTRFIEKSGLRGPRGKRGKRGPTPKVACKLLKHHKIKCKVTFRKSRKTAGTLSMSISRGHRLAAIGHGRLAHNRATITMRELHPVSRGMWRVTLVVHSHKRATTTAFGVRMP